MLAVCHLPPAELLWKVVFAVSNDLPASSEEEMISNTTTRRRSAEGIEPSRVCGAYATMTQQAIENAVASFEGPTHVLWVGGKLSRETEGTDNLLNAAGIPDATVAMVESLVKAKKYTHKHSITLESTGAKFKETHSTLNRRFTHNSLQEPSNVSVWKYRHIHV